MGLAHSAIISWNIYSQPNGFLGIRNTHLTHHLTIGTRDVYPSLYGQLNFPGVDVQVFSLPSQGRTAHNSFNIVGMDPHNHSGITTLPTHQSDLKHHSRLTI